MLSQLRKLVEAPARSDAFNRLGAWWDGREPSNLAPETIGARSSEMEPSGKSAASGDALTALRLAAIEQLWGEGRLNPGSEALQRQLLDSVFDCADQPGDIGYIGVDAALLNAARARSDRRFIAVEWRTQALPAMIEKLAGVAEIHGGEPDRPKQFIDNLLEGLLSVDAFAYSDHKAGLVARAYRTLTPSGRWSFLETTRTTAKTPPEAFASAWAEPQLATADEIDGMLEIAGFRSVQKRDVSDDVIAAARTAFSAFGAGLDHAVRAGLNGRDGALFLQELTWEVRAWKARLRAIAGGALRIHLYIVDKTARDAAAVQFSASPSSQTADNVMDGAAAMDQSAVDSLFD